MFFFHPCDLDSCTVMDLIEMERRKQLTLIQYVIVNILSMFTALCTITKTCYQKWTLMERPTNKMFLRVEILIHQFMGVI